MSTESAQGNGADGERMVPMDSAKKTRQLKKENRLQVFSLVHRLRVSHPHHCRESIRRFWIRETPMPILPSGKRRPRTSPEDSSRTSSSTRATKQVRHWLPPARSSEKPSSDKEKPEQVNRPPSIGANPRWGFCFA